MAITKEQAIDILEKFDFFQGQRAGRELWNDKPFEVQEQDIKDFSNDVALLKEYISDVVPKSEVENFNKSKGGFCPLCGSYIITQEMMEELRMAHKELGQHGDPVGEKGILAEEAIKSEVAREIFEDIEDNYADFIFDGHRNIVVLTEKDFTELKKKYTEKKNG